MDSKRASNPEVRMTGLTKRSQNSVESGGYQVPD